MWRAVGIPDFELETRCFKSENITNFKRGYIFGTCSAIQESTDFGVTSVRVALIENKIT